MSISTTPRFLTEQQARFLRFLAVGAINSVFSYSVYALLTYLKVHYALAVLLANVLGVLFNFKTTGKLVFRSNDNRLISRFALAYGVIYLLSVAGLKLLLLIGLDRYLGGAVVALPVAGVTFIVMSRWVFGNSQRAPRGE